MKTNIGLADKTIRLIIAVVIMACYFFDIMSGSAAILLLLLAVLLMLTSLVSFCPFYAFFGINTCKIKHSK